MRQIIPFIANTVISVVLSLLVVFLWFVLLLAYNGYTTTQMSFFVIGIAIFVCILGVYGFLLYKFIGKFFTPGLVSLQLFTLLNVGLPFVVLLCVLGFIWFFVLGK